MYGVLHLFVHQMEIDTLFILLMTFLYSPGSTQLSVKVRLMVFYANFMLWLKNSLIAKLNLSIHIGVVNVVH